MDTTTAIIQFIGIVLFSASIPNDPGVHAILPRIGHVHQQTIQAASSGTSGTADQQSFVPNVEDHAAVILYRKTDRLAKTRSWTPKLLTSGWEYVKLDGERVQFLTDGANDAPQIPPLLPRAGASCATTGTSTSLRSVFQAPYRGAIAVFDIPAGALDACESSSSGRVDTRLLVKTGGVLVIVANKPGNDPKSVTLRSDAVVYVANVPPQFLNETGDIVRSSGEPHWDAYNAMLGQSCGRPQPEKPEGLYACDRLAFSEAYKSARRNPPTKTLPNMVDSECSNTQWP